MRTRQPKLRHKPKTPFRPLPVGPRGGVELLLIHSVEHVGKQDLARGLRAAIDRVLREDDVRTGDLGGQATTKELTQAIVRRLA